MGWAPPKDKRKRQSLWQQTCSRGVLPRWCNCATRACTIFRREFIEIGNIEVFFEAFTTASACNKVLRKKFLTPYTIGLTPLVDIAVIKRPWSGSYKWSKKTNAKYHMPETDANTDYQNYRSTVWTDIVTRQGACTSFWAVIFTVIPFVPSRISVHSAVTLSERYERTMNRIEHIAKAGYKVKIKWECEFDEAKIAENKPELLTHPIVLREKNKRCPIRGSKLGYASSLWDRWKRDHRILRCYVYTHTSVRILSSH